MIPGLLLARTGSAWLGEFIGTPQMEKQAHQRLASWKLLPVMLGALWIVALLVPETSSNLPRLPS